MNPPVLWPLLYGWHQTNQVSVGEGAGSCIAAKSYTTLVVHAIIQTRLPVLQRTSQRRKVFYTLSFALTANVARNLIFKVQSRFFKEIRSDLKEAALHSTRARLMADNFTNIASLKTELHLGALSLLK